MRCLAEIGVGLKMVRKTNVVFASRAVAFGAAECAATQTVHLAESVAPVWWCAARANADQKVSSMQNQPSCFENRISTLGYGP
jgi:hypothetical protein